MEDPFLEVYLMKDGLRMIHLEALQGVGLDKGCQAYGPWAEFSPWSCMVQTVSR